jgi:ligand-binding sensor domain-containing protein
MQRISSIPVFVAIMWLVCFNNSLNEQIAYSRSMEIDESNAIISPHILFKDHNGFLWVGTTNGLYRFNGLRMQAVSFPGDTLPEITALAETRNGIIWAGCINGRIAVIKNN